MCDCDPDSLLTFLRQCPAPPQGNVGRAPTLWASQVDGDHDVPGLANQPIDRLYLTQLRETAASPGTMFMSIMAWGGMRVDHGRRAWAQRDEWTPTLQMALDGQSDRAQLYSALSALETVGMGPAFFTKLIHFCQSERHPRGYIMDQWTAKSIELLSGRPVVALSNSGHVERRNDAQVYKEFCGLTEKLAREVGLTGAQTEEKIFSRGGRNPLPWRQRVRDCWKPA